MIPCSLPDYEIRNLHDLMQHIADVSALMNSGNCQIEMTIRLKRDVDGVRRIYLQWHNIGDRGFYGETLPAHKPMRLSWRLIRSKTWEACIGRVIEDGAA